MENEVIYVVGKITGDPNYKEKFKQAKEHLNELGFNQVIIPTCVPDNLPYECYTPISIGFVQSCTSLYVLPDWQESKGARAEVAYAQFLRKDCVFA